MNTKAFGALAACIAGLAVLLCGLSVAMELPMRVEIVMIVGALLLLASAGAFIGATVAEQKKSRV
ncbi:hypothetical protein BJF85_05115 [Saccharomonospora sp. CUA-673]|uniref:hypothetical protein n=1 Tax=Saccharomonospora sp. CUA-673 TaxID=1904969 RepID=UPI00095C97A5|nr:hypothetical protein [Saccharomonospora sp. CUA-673]OLT41776.1 hypothetical protein BJF85_05115 [Saccharomonospora sp. CUA-673]